MYVTIDVGLWRRKDDVTVVVVCVLLLSFRSQLRVRPLDVPSQRARAVELWTTSTVLAESSPPYVRTYVRNFYSSTRKSVEHSSERAEPLWKVAQQVLQQPRKDGSLSLVGCEKHDVHRMGAMQLDLGVVPDKVH